MATSPEKRKPDSDAPSSATKKRPSDVTLDSTTLGDLLEYKNEHHPSLARDVVSFDHTDTVGYALEQLAKHHIMAAPVRLASSLEDNDEGSYLGIVDSQCLLAYITSLAKDMEVQQKESGESLPKHAYLGATTAEFLEKKLIVVCGNDTGFSFAGSQLQRPLREVISEVFLAQQKHRIMLSNARGAPVALLTQSDVVQFALAHPTCCGGLLDRTVEELGLDGQVVCVSQNLPAIEAFERISEQNVSSVGIVNDAGVLIGNLSASDLKGMGWNDMKLLALPVARFLALEGFHKHEDEFTTLAKAQQQRNKKLGVHSCKSTDTLHEVLRQITAHRIHRIYVVAADGTPTGIITLTDILNLLVAN